MTVPAWLVPWAVWRIANTHLELRLDRPAKVPARIGEKYIWVPAWVWWRMNGRKGKRPKDAPTRIPTAINAQYETIAKKVRALQKQGAADATSTTSPLVSNVDRITWVECHGYYNPAEAEVDRMLDDAARWHNWPNVQPMLGISNDWPLSRYPELGTRTAVSFWRWEQITDFWQLTAGGYLWVSDGFDTVGPNGEPKTPTGDVEKLAQNLATFRAKGAIVQAGHTSGGQAQRLRDLGYDVQAWASCEQISQATLKQALADLKPSRFVGQVEGQGERAAMAAYVQAGVFAGVPWDTVISGWGDFAAL